MADDVVPMGRPDPDPTVLTTANLLREIANLEKLVTQRLDAEERNRVEQKNDMKEALNAALAAAKEAVAKTEVNTDKSLEEQAKTSAVAFSALEGRVSLLEKQTFGSSEHLRGGQDQTRALYGFAGFLSVLLVIGTVLAANGVFR